ncbi:polysaccharide deacetylase family protein [Bacillus sp. 3255]|uniref:polysaccharide deacetylase family protein n=1 Tax=Bacillus sp. 3255 TaxID=2817904 RepID=UPI00286D325C|nr:polysaccharide deacetylase family protein [Bacillus sp. 3255]
MRRKLIIAGAVLLLVILLLYGFMRFINLRSFQLFGGITDHVETSEKVVAITFDDGPTKQVDPILDILSKFDARATFFVIGHELKDNMEEARKIVNAGHQMGNHSYSHERFIFQSRSYVQREIEETNKLIREAGYADEIDFRPPYGKKLFSLPRYLHEHDIQTIMWSLEPDTSYTGAADKIKAVEEGIRPGAIILLHPMYDTSGQELLALEGILEMLSRQGYRFVTVNELQEYANHH